MKWLTIILILCLACPAFAGGDGIIGDSVRTATSDIANEHPSHLAYQATAKHTAVEGDVVDSMYIWSFSSAGGTISGRIYDITSGDTTAVGDTVIWDINTATHQWFVLPVNIPLTAGNVYVFAHGQETGSVGTAAELMGGNTASRQISATLGATWVPDSDDLRRYVAYATVKNIPTDTTVTLGKCTMGKVEM